MSTELQIDTREFMTTAARFLPCRSGIISSLKRPPRSRFGDRIFRVPEAARSNVQSGHETFRDDCQSSRRSG